MVQKGLEMANDILAGDDIPMEGMDEIHRVYEKSFSAALPLGFQFFHLAIIYPVVRVSQEEGEEAAREALEKYLQAWGAYETIQIIATLSGADYEKVYGMFVDDCVTVSKMLLMPKEEWMKKYGEDALRKIIVFVSNVVHLRDSVGRSMRGIRDGDQNLFEGYDDFMRRFIFAMSEELLRTKEKNPQEIPEDVLNDEFLEKLLRDGVPEEGKNVVGKTVRFRPQD